MQDHKSDSRYKRYETAIDRNLVSFETISEWADIIAFLSRLNKTLSSCPQFTEIPRKLIIAKRLAQCLNPNLPSGVHQKTLETYSVIFEKIGIDGLAQDLPIYTLGIFPFFEHASSMVRIEVLNIVEKYILPLGTKLAPYLPPAIIALLPGLEEETGEHFEICANLFDKIILRLGKGDFFNALWGSLLASSGHRIACVNYLARSVPKAILGEDVAKFCMVDIKLISSACVVALADSQILAVRKILDFCIVHFPLSSLSVATDRTEILIAQSILMTLLRRDMSLSRRAFTYLSGDQSSSYGFPEESIDKTCLALKGIVLQAGEIVEGLSKALKILVFLNDRTELFDEIVSKMILDLISLAQLAHSTNSEAFSKQLTVSFRNFFECVKADSLCSTISQKISASQNEGLLRLSENILFAVEKLSITENCLNAPDQLLSLCRDFFNRLKGIHNPSIKEITCLIQLLRKTIYTLDELPSGKSVIAESKLIDDLADFLDFVYSAFTSAPVEDVAKLFEELSLLFGSLLGTVVSAKYPSRFYAVLERSASQTESVAVWSFLARIFFAIEKIMPPQDPLEQCRLIRDFRSTIFAKAWDFMNDESNVSKVADLISESLDSIDGEWDTFSAKTLMEAVQSSGKVEAIRRATNFISYWLELTDTRCDAVRNTIMVIFGFLQDQTSEPRSLVLSWLARSPEKLASLIYPFVQILNEVLLTIDEPSMTYVTYYSGPFNADQLAFVLAQLNLILESSSQGVTDSLNSEPLCEPLHDSLVGALPQKYRLVSPVLGVSIPMSLVIRLTSLLGNAVIHSLICMSLTYNQTQPIAHDLICSFSCTESKCNNLCSKVEEIQLHGLKLTATLIEQFSAVEMPQLYCIYDALIGKLQYMLQISSYGTQDRVLDCLTLLIRKMYHLKSTCEKPMPETESLVQCASQFFRQASVKDSNSFLAWIRFICRSMPMLEEPHKITAHTCEALAQKIVLEGAAWRTSNITPLAITGLADVISALLSVSKDRLRDAEALEILAPMLGMSLGVVADAFCSVKVTSAKHAIFSNFFRIYTHAEMWALCSIILYWGKDSKLLPIHILSSPICRILFQFRPDDKRQAVKALSGICKNMRDGKVEAFQRLLPEYCVALALALVKNVPDADTLQEALSLSLSVLKDNFIPNLRQFRPCFDVYFYLVQEVLYENTALSLDKKVLRDYHDTNLRLAENMILIASKYNENSQWSCYDQTISEADLISVETVMSWLRDKTIARILLTAIECLIPHAEIFFENDRISIFISSIFTNLILPGLKNTIKGIPVRAIASKLLGTVCMQRSLAKYWKKDFWDYFTAEHCLFNASEDSLTSLAIHMTQFLCEEPDKLQEILNKVPSSNSTNLFLSREMEAYNRAVSLRRLSFAALCSEEDLLKSVLPEIQEKIADVLKLGTGQASSEVYLILRVLIYKLRDDMPNTMWPVIFSEILMLFDSVIKQHDFQLMPSTLVSTLIQACKFIDDIFMGPITIPTLCIWGLINGTGGINYFAEISKSFASESRYELDEGTMLLSKRRPLVPQNATVSKDLLVFFKYTPLRCSRWQDFLKSTPDRIFLMTFLRTLRW